MPASDPRISSIRAQEILDSRGTPTVKATITLQSGVRASAAVPSGASTGSNEAVELRDGDPKRYFGKGVRKVIAHIEGEIAEAFKGRDCAIRPRSTRRSSRSTARPTRRVWAPMRCWR